FPWLPPLLRLVTERGAVPKPEDAMKRELDEFTGILLHECNCFLLCPVDVTLLAELDVFLQLSRICSRMETEITHPIRIVVVPKMKLEPKIAPQKDWAPKYHGVPDYPRKKQRQEQGDRNGQIVKPWAALAVS